MKRTQTGKGHKKPGKDKKNLKPALTSTTSSEAKAPNIQQSFKKEMVNSATYLSYLAESFREIEMCYMTLTFNPKYLHDLCNRFLADNFTTHLINIPQSALRITWSYSDEQHEYVETRRQENCTSEKINLAFALVKRYSELFTQRRAELPGLYWHRQIKFYHSLLQPEEKKQSGINSGDTVPQKLAQLYHHFLPYEEIMCVSALKTADLIYTALEANPNLTTNLCDNIMQIVFTGRDITTVSQAGIRTILPRIDQYITDLSKICLTIHSKLHRNNNLPSLPKTLSLPRSNSTPEFFRNLPELKSKTPSELTLLTRNEQKVILDTRDKLTKKAAKEEKTAALAPSSAPLTRSTSATQLSIFKPSPSLPTLKLSEKEAKLIMAQRQKSISPSGPSS